jgi:hypothetical protein
VVYTFTSEEVYSIIIHLTIDVVHSINHRSNYTYSLATHPCGHVHH